MASSTGLGEPQGLECPMGITGHNHLSTISSKPSNSGNLSLRLRDKGYVMFEESFSLFLNPGTPPQAPNGYVIG